MGMVALVINARKAPYDPFQSLKDFDPIITEASLGYSLTPNEIREIKKDQPTMTATLYTFYCDPATVEQSIEKNLSDRSIWKRTDLGQHLLSFEQTKAKAVCVFTIGEPFAVASKQPPPGVTCYAVIIRH